MIPEEVVPQEVEEVPQEVEEVSQDQPQEVGILPVDSEDESKEAEEEYTPEGDSDSVSEEEPIYRKAVEFHTYGEEALKASGRLRGLLHKVGITTNP